MWNVPADHEMFAQVNTAQWLWYFHNFMKDQEEDFTAERDMVEYHVSFTEPDIVKKVRKIREETVQVEDASFYKGVEKMFGRSIDPTGSSQSIEGGIHDIDLNEVMRNMQNTKYRESNNDPSLNYRHWSTFNLG
jgi:hypothetical protein